MVFPFTICSSVRLATVFTCSIAKCDYEYELSSVAKLIVTMEENYINTTASTLQLVTDLPEKTKKDSTSKNVDETPPLLFSKRLLVATVLFLCFINFQILRNNINIIIVEMTSNDSYTEGNSTIVTKEADFNWDTTTIGLIFSILAYGGLFSVFGDLVINRFGGSVTCAWCMLMAGIFTVLHPAILYINFYLFLVCRFLTGIFEMFFYVSTSDIFSRWFPFKERSTLISFSFNGTNIGVAAVYPFCGYLAHRWGWQIAFYVTGFLSIVSSILCLILVKNQPSDDKWISKKELAYILEKTERSTKMKVNHPYKSIFTSVPVWTLCITTFVFMWIASVLNACLPLYVQDQTHKETDEIGLISSIPNTVYIFMFPINGAFMDYWKNHSKITTTEIHKIITSIAFLFASVMFLATAWTSNLTASLIFFVLIQIPMSFMPIIVQVLMVNLAPEHSSVVAGLSSCFFSISAIAAQTITGFMVTNHTSQEWNNCFYLASAISSLGAVIFALHGSSEPQSWALTSPTNEERQSSEMDCK